jgi:hypothetical protein
MGGRTKYREIPADVVRAAGQFVQWRSRRDIGARIPEPLWRRAVTLAGRHGLSRTATALRLDYYALKKRVEAQASVTRRDLIPRPAFVELAASTPVPSGECLIELAHATGATLRIHLKGHELPDLVALGRSFWNVE